MWKKIGNSLKRKRDRSVSNPDAMISVNLANTNENLITAKSARARKLAARHRRMFIAIYSAFGAVIVGLAVAIVIVNINGVSGNLFSIGESSEECTGEDDQETTQQEADDIGEEIDDTIAEIGSMPYDEGLSYIDGKILEYEGTDYEFGLRMIKLNLLMNQAEAEAAYEESAKISLEGIGNADVLKYYVVMIDIGEALDDDDIITQYQNLLTALKQKMERDLG